jgi:DNA-binding MarR family transcriptional regulator
MPQNERTEEAEALTNALLDLFRLNSLLLTTGDRLVADLGLTSARWRILSAIYLSERPQPVAWLARDMGTNRQNVQRIVNEMRNQELVALEPNPHHRRAPLVVLTAKGRHAYEEATRIQIPWINDFSQGLKLKDIQTTRRVISLLRERLESDDNTPVT